MFSAIIIVREIGMNTQLTLENKIALYFKHRRESDGLLSRTKLAELLGVNVSVVTNYENLRNNIQLSVFLKLMGIFSLSEHTIRSFLGDLEYMDFEESVPSAVNAGKELALAMGGVLSEDEIDPVMKSEGNYTLSNEDFYGLVKSMNNPPAHSNKLKEARERYLESKNDEESMQRKIAYAKSRIVKSKNMDVKTMSEDEFKDYVVNNPPESKKSHLEWVAGSENIHVKSGNIRIDSDEVINGYHQHLDSDINEHLKEESKDKKESDEISWDE
jgi:transcriptional regulator with XRE-family HTH domain